MCHSARAKARIITLQCEKRLEILIRLRMTPYYSIVIFVVLFPKIDANLRCYSCAPCNELEIYAGDVTHFEQDCYLDRYCMKVRIIVL